MPEVSGRFGRTKGRWCIWNEVTILKVKAKRRWLRWTGGRGGRPSLEL